MDTRQKIGSAEFLARHRHREQVDLQGQPYAGHLQRVAESLPETYRDAGWLHDIVEDTNVTVSDLLAYGFAPATVAAVDIVSRRSGETYASYIDRVAGSKSQMAIAVKLADLTDNLRAGVIPSMAKRYHTAIKKLLDKQKALAL